MAPEFQSFLGRRLPRVVRALFVFAPLAEEEQPLVMLPFGVVALLRGPAHLDHFVFAVKNCPKILELGFYVFNCKTGEKENKLGEHFGLTASGIRGWIPTPAFYWLWLGFCVLFLILTSSSRNRK